LNDNTNLIGTYNVGYEIIKQGKQSVIGYNSQRTFDQYVAWSYNFDQNNKPNYFWGHYGDLEHAEKHYLEKEDKIF